MIDQRGYQENFHASFERIRDRDRRINRADKITWALQKQLPADLSEAICVDVGCSAGVITARLAAKFGLIVGIDYDHTGLAAIEPGDKAAANFTHGDALFLPFADESVDLIICAQVYEHMPDDVLMASEIHRVLRPGGYCFFSGPNWLFPIEPHFFLPFLHWLPEAWADRYLQLSGQGRRYYERSRTIWGLRRLWRRFEIEDITVAILREFYLVRRQDLVASVLRPAPDFVWRAVLPLFPNYNWILRKPEC